jgi:hypothetical protein
MTIPVPRASALRVGSPVDTSKELAMLDDVAVADQNEIRP